MERETYDITVTNQSGEIVYYRQTDNCPIVSVKKYETDKMLLLAKKVSDLDKDMLLSYCYSSRRINTYMQIKTYGYNFISHSLMKKLKQKENKIVMTYILSIIETVHFATYKMMKNKKTKIKSWGELFELIECTNKNNQAKIKKFLVDNNVVRKVKLKKEEDFVLIFNPFLCKKGKYAGLDACITFSDFMVRNENVDPYCYMYLVAIGEKEFEIFTQEEIEHDEKRGKDENEKQNEISTI